MGGAGREGKGRREGKGGEGLGRKRRSATSHFYNLITE